MLKKKPHLK
jgi:hypothetical protein